MGFAIMFHVLNDPILSSFMTYRRVYSNTTGASSEEETAYPSGVHSRVLVGFVLLNLSFSVKSFMDRCFSFCPFLLLVIALSILL